jgi:LysR family transcriptional activator of nhaA
MLSSVNYNHLRYFWTVARTGSVTAAARVLNLTQPTVSAQLRLFEQAAGVALFDGEGRDRRLTDAGRLLFRFAEEVFSLEREVHDAFAGLPTGRTRPFRVGVTDGIPKLLVHRFLTPVLTLEAAPRLVVREGPQDALLEALDDHALDLVLLDAPATGRVKGRAHAVGESEVAIFGTAALVKQYRRGFPQSLDGAPLLLPSSGTVLRQMVDAWLAVEGIHPRLVAEVDDSALLKAFGTAGHGLFALPVTVAEDAAQRYGVRPVGLVGGARVLYYAVSVGRKLDADTTRIVEAIARQLVVA